MLAGLVSIIMSVVAISIFVFSSSWGNQLFAQLPISNYAAGQHTFNVAGFFETNYQGTIGIPEIETTALLTAALFSFSMAAAVFLTRLHDRHK